jgi:hypothetical protein
MQCNARTNINAAWGGAGAFGVASLPGNLIASGFGKYLRRRRSHESVCFGQPCGQRWAHCVCYIYGVGGVASFNSVCNVRAPPPNNSFQRTPVHRFRFPKRCGRRR